MIWILKDDGHYVTGVEALKAIVESRGTIVMKSKERARPFRRAATQTSSFCPRRVRDGSAPSLSGGELC